MNETHCLMVIHPCAKYGKPMSIQKKSFWPDTKTCQKPYKFDLKVKEQGHIWIMKVLDTSSHGKSEELGYKLVWPKHPFLMGAIICIT